MDLDIFGGNLCKAYFASLTFFIVICGILINLCEPHLPVFISRVFRYGKFANKKDSSWAKKLEVPKAYFKHFYLTTVIFYYPVAFNEVVSAYVFDSDVPEWFVHLLDFFCGPNRIATVPTTSVFVAVILILLQACRRFFDTHFVSVFSKNAKMNFSHYLVGMTYYPGVMLVVLSEAPKFAPVGFEGHKLSFSDVGYGDMVAVLIFLWAWYHQHVATVILANLRKNVRGDIVSNSYKLPEGDWFGFLSSPHSTAEIIMYTALTWFLWSNSGWWFVYAWVVSNQIESILLSHWWYQSHFKDFPRKRKALIPCVY